MRSRLTVAALLAAALASCQPQPPASPEPLHTQWRAWLDSPGGELPFGLELRQTADGVRATIVNGEERSAVSRVARDGSKLTLRIDHYDATIEATLGEDGHGMHGRWTRTGSGGTTTGLDFHAAAGNLPRFPRSTEPPDARVLEHLSGRWAVDFADDDQPAVGLFDARPDGTVSGTFLTTTGDYRFLEGRLDAGTLRLSVFDGAHAFLFAARFAGDGTLAGDFWSRGTYHDTWTASKDPEATLPDAFELTRWVGGLTLGEVAYPDLDGRLRSLDDPAFAGRARILEIFGSWCPNCNDASGFLVELHRKYASRGLSIVGLAFEHSGDFERDAEQVRRYARHHGIEFPLLIAGVSDKQEASRAFPLLDRVRSYPTTVFMHGDGRVRAVHQGYAGPATGDANRELRARFETLVQELLAEEHGAS